MSRAGRWFWNIFQALAIGLIFYFLFRTLAAGWSELAGYQFSIRLGPFVLATALVVAGFSGWFLLWHLITIRLGIALPPGPALSSFFYSQIGKYLPGKVWAFAARFYLYQRAGKDKALLSVAVVLEGVFHLASHAVILLFASTFTSLQLPGWVRLVSVSLLAAGLVFCHPKLLEKIVNLALRLAKRDQVIVRLRYWDLLLLLVLFSVQYLFLCGGLYFLIVSIYPLGTDRFIDVCLAAAATGVASTLAIFAPAGLGVREVMYYLTLRMILPDSFAIILALVNRIWGTSIEWLMIGLVFAASKLGLLGDIVKDDEAQSGPAKD